MAHRQPPKVELEILSSSNDPRGVLLRIGTSDEDRAQAINRLRDFALSCENGEAATLLLLICDTAKRSRGLAGGVVISSPFLPERK